MGADLYIRSISDKARAEHKPAFEKAVAQRDRVKTRRAQKAAQARVEAAYDRMYGQGYFRDSYNPSSLAWALGISWWRDVVPQLDDESMLSVELTRVLRERIAAATVAPDEEQLANCLKFEDMKSRDDVVAYFEKERKALLAFLDTAIELNEPIYCSL
jgi:hypothetical protein